MLQQPLARRVALGQRGARRPAKRCQGHCLCRVCGVAHEAYELPFQPMERQRKMPGRARRARPAGGFIAALDRPAEPSLTNGKPHLRVVGSRRTATRPRKQRE